MSEVGRKREKEKRVTEHNNHVVSIDMEVVVVAIKGTHSSTTAPAGDVYTHSHYQTHHTMTGWTLWA